MRPQQSIALCAGAALLLVLAALPVSVSGQESQPSSGSNMMPGGTTAQPMMMSPGMMMPSMDAANGRKLFAAKGCVVCHAVNGIGGQDAAALDASTMQGMT
ncbi:MAG: c-type cytochrome, partial [Burkholderiales bacterium]